MKLSFKEKCISVALSISLGAFAPSAAFASQDEGNDGTGYRQEITLKDAADNAISETLGASIFRSRFRAVSFGSRYFFGECCFGQ